MVDASQAFKNLDQTELLRAAMIPDTGHGARWNLQPLLSFFCYLMLSVCCDDQLALPVNGLVPNVLMC